MQPGTIDTAGVAAEEQAVDERDRALRFEIPLLSRRLSEAVDWLRQKPETANLGMGLFGASTGAAAALVAAAERPEDVGAVVSRGGRPDLAMASLPAVRAPTLLIVGGLDGPVIDMNTSAAAAPGCRHETRIISGATHLFPEPGKLETVAKPAAEWFVEHLT